MTHKKFRLIVVGDEILSGKRQDKHMSKMIELLNERGLSLHQVEYVGDDREAITSVLKKSFATDDVVFSTGGIGSTPDDHCVPLYHCHTPEKNVKRTLEFSSSSFASNPN
jgi:molybdopterin-biosynthesis enzyme MoeA-like protein